MDELLESLLTRIRSLEVARTAITDKVKRDHRTDLSVAEDREFRELSTQIGKLHQSAVEVKFKIEEDARSGRGNAATEMAVRANLERIFGVGKSWATRAATAVGSMGGENRAVTSGSVDVPTLVEADVVTPARPERLIDLLVNRRRLEGNSFEYFRQSVRTNNAAPVADGAVKPTSVFTVDPVEDRARVVAHLSEPVPLRLLADHAELERWLDSEMREGVLDALEAQVLSGSGSGENMRGLLATSGLTTVANLGAGNELQTLRAAVTAMQIAGEKPTGWVLHPSDAATVDLARWGEEGGYLTDGYQNANSGSANVFGVALPRVVSKSVPAGTAVLGDWDKLRLYVREDVRIDVDAGGDLFKRNQAVLRAEGRFGVAVLRPSAFAVVDLVP